MAIDKKEETRRQPMWMPHAAVARTPGHPLYKRFNQILDKEHFDEWREGPCEPYFHRGGRPSVPPGVYARMLIVGYFEGIASGRAIAWRCVDSLRLPEFPGFDPAVRSTPIAGGAARVMGNGR